MFIKAFVSFSSQRAFTWRALLGCLVLIWISGVFAPEALRAQDTSRVEIPKKIKPPGDGEDCTIRGVPGGLSPGDGAEVADASVTFSWRPVSDPNADSYQIEVYEGSNASGTKVYTTIVGGTSTTASGAFDPETNYTWRARGYGPGCESGSGVGPWSAAPTFETKTVRPSTPSLEEPGDGATGLTATPTLDWDRVERADAYRVQVAPIDDFSDPVLDEQVSSSGYSWSDRPRLNYETTYHWRVKAKNEAGASAWSGARSFTTDIQPPGTPQLVSPADDASGLPTSVTLDWQAADHTDEYYVEVSTPAGGTVQSTTTEVTEWTVDGLTGHTYQWYVRARNQSRATSSETWSFATRVPPAAQRMRQSVHSVTSASITVPVNNESEIGALSARERRISIAYVDALGRSLQSVAVAESPNGHDVVTPVTRDELGRQTTTLLPYAAPAGKGYRPDALAEQDAFYQAPPGGVVATDVPRTDYPYSRRVLERSPLEREGVQGAPGALWQPADPNIDGSGHTTRIGRGANAGDEVRRFRVTEGGASLDGYYPAGTLFKTRTTDPNGDVSVVYKDKAGREVMKKSRVEESTWAETYYLYDRRGRLRFVVPPMGTKALGEEEDFDSVRSKWATEYRYDGYGREIEKHMPEEEVVTTVYDRLGRVVLRQDGLMREESDWLFTKYDRYGRKALTGIYHPGDAKDGWTRADMQGHVDGLAAEERYEERSSGGHGYTNQAFPQLNGNDVVWTVRYYDDYDFDRTGEKRDAQFAPAQGFPAEGFSDGDMYVEGHRPFFRLKGKRTRTKTRVLEAAEQEEGRVLRQAVYDQPLPAGPETFYLKGASGGDGTLRLKPGFETNPGQTVRIGPNVEVPPEEGGGSAPKWLVETFFYDRKGRTIQMQAQSPLLGGETTTTSTQYDFSGKALQVRTEHHSARGSARTMQRFEYDDAGRRVRTFHAVGDGAEVLLSGRTYNALGEEVERGLHSTDGGSAFRQRIDYRRNVRGWLAGLNDSGAGSGGDGSGNDGVADLFSMELTYAGRYDYLEGKRRYDGSVSQMRWRAGPDSAMHGYGYIYDGLGRLTGAHYAEREDGEEVNAGRYSVEDVTYDLSGNLTSLTRRGWSGLIDELTYHYASGAGNRLTDVTDAAPETDGRDFSGDGSRDADAYQYDGNGNLVADRNKGIEHIDVGYLNLPEQIDFGEGNRIRYTWAADGRKLRKRVYSGGAVSEAKHYALGSFVYEADSSDDPALAYFPHAEGRALAAGDGSWEYEYHLTDHLGNTRVAFVPDGSGGANVVQRAAYYPYGLRLAGLGSSESENDYLFGGKELEEAHGLRWYHYGARFYDPATARWASMDPADEFHSPYSYVGGDPVNLVDPDGRQAASPFDSMEEQLYWGLGGWLLDSGYQDAEAKAIYVKNNPGEVAHFIGESAEAAGAGYDMATLGLLGASATPAAPYTLPSAGVTSTMSMGCDIVAMCAYGAEELFWGGRPGQTWDAALNFAISEITAGVINRQASKVLVKAPNSRGSRYRWAPSKGDGLGGQFAPNAFGDRFTATKDATNVILPHVVGEALQDDEQ